MPCVLKGEVLNVSDNCVDVIKKSLSFVKRLGQNRTRGLGRCDIKVEKVRG